MHISLFGIMKFQKSGNFQFSKKNKKIFILYKLYTTRKKFFFVACLKIFESTKSSLVNYEISKISKISEIRKFPSRKIKIFLYSHQCSKKYLNFFYVELTPPTDYFKKRRMEKNLGNPIYTSIENGIYKKDNVDQCCRWDTEPLDPNRDILHAPVREKNGIISVMGNFCSFACVRAFMENNPKIFNESSIYLLLKYARSYGIYDPFSKAPPQEALLKFGGDKTIEEFRALGVTHFTCLRMPPFTFEDVKVQAVRRINEPISGRESQLDENEFRQKLASKSQLFLDKKNRKKLDQNSIEAFINKNGGNS